jgi:hypothetical protein
VNKTVALRNFICSERFAIRDLFQPPVLSSASEVGNALSGRILGVMNDLGRVRFSAISLKAEQRSLS